MKPAPALAPIIGLLLAASATAQPAPPPAPPAAITPAPALDAATQARVDRILRQTPLIDGHNDWPGTLLTQFGDARYRADLAAPGSGAKQPTHTDIPRLRQGRVGGQFWSVYTPFQQTGPIAVKLLFEQIDLVHDMIRRHPRDLELALTAGDIVRIHRQGRIASLIGMEGGYAIDNSLPVLRQAYARGARYMTLTHNRNLPWADSATDAPQHDGLTDFGRAVVAEMNRLGMMVDLSHVAPATMMDALDASKAPVIFSHSSARALCDHPRNVPDDVLKRLPANGGVVMVTFVPQFIDCRRFDWQAARVAEQARLENRFVGQPDRVRDGMAAWNRANPAPEVTVATVADHIDHVARIAGHDHVGIGGDHDGVPSLPTGLGGVDGYPLVFAELIRRGWTDENLRKLAGGNLLRVMRANEAYARSQADRPVGDAVLKPAGAEPHDD